MKPPPNNIWLNWDVSNGEFHGLSFEPKEREHSVRYERSVEKTAIGIAPNWSEAPYWAKWWAVDSNGIGKWFQNEPYYDFGYWITDSGNRSTHRELDLPIGIDWRQTAQARPQTKG